MAERVVQLDPVPVVDCLLVHLNYPGQAGSHRAVLTDSSAQLTVGPVEGLLDLNGSVARLAHVVAGDERVLDTEIGGPVAGRHVLLHALLTHVAALANHLDSLAVVVELSAVELEKF